MRIEGSGGLESSCDVPSVTQLLSGRTYRIAQDFDSIPGIFIGFQILE